MRASDEFIVFAEMLHKANAKISVSPGASNTSIHPDLRGMYVTAQIGLRIHSWFIGVKNNKLCIESTV